MICRLGPHAESVHSGNDKVVIPASIKLQLAGHDHFKVIVVVNGVVDSVSRGQGHVYRGRIGSMWTHLA